MVFALQSKKNVLMMGLFAVVGFNISLNPESIEVRRTIASQKAAQKAELASETDSIPMLSVNLSRILEEMTRQEEELHVTRGATVIRKNGGKDVDYVEVEFKVTNVEGQNPFLCRECAKGWHKVKFNANIFDTDRSKFQENLDKKLAQTIDQMRDKDKGRDELARGRPDLGNTEGADLGGDNCDQSDLGDRLSCKLSNLTDRIDQCKDKSTEQKRRDCFTKFRLYYSVSLEAALEEGFRSDSVYTRSKAVEIRNKLLSTLPTTVPFANEIRNNLKNKSLAAIKEMGQKQYDLAVKECRPRVRTQLELAQCADSKLLDYLNSLKSGIGDMSLAGTDVSKEFRDDLAKWQPNGKVAVPNQGPAGRIAGQPGQLKNHVQRAVCPGPQCPQTGRTSAFPNGVGSDGKIIQNFRPYTGQPGDGAPGSTFLKPF